MTSASFMSARKSGHRPVMIAIGGLSGSGKSSLAYALAHEIPGSQVIDSDIMRKRMHGVGAYDPLPPEAYTPENTLRFIDYVQQEQAEALQSHRVIIVTGTFLDALTRGRQQELAMRCNADFVGLWLKAPMNTLFARVGTRMQGRSASDADRKVLKKQLKLPTRTPHGAIEWRLLNANQPLPHLVEDAKEAVSDAARKFGGHRPLKIKPPKYFT